MVGVPDARVCGRRENGEEVDEIGRCGKGARIDGRVASGRREHLVEPGRSSWGLR